jgi:hypothetical protein
MNPALRGGGASAWRKAGGFRMIRPEGAKVGSLGREPQVGISLKIKSPGGAAERLGLPSEATERAREIAINQRSEVVIHRRDGRIRDSDSYGNDPNPPRDRKH